MKFNILCVTEYKSQNEINWHVDRTGEAEVVGDKVKFEGKEWKLYSLREGLTGSALTLDVSGDGSHTFEFLSLYTDTPVSNHTREEVLAMFQLEQDKRKKGDS